MKNLIFKNAKKWLLYSCGIFAVLALAFFAIPTVKADASVDASVMPAPQLKRGASIRIIKNDYAENGLRFTMLFSQSNYNVLSEKTTVTEEVAAEITDLKFGMLIVPEAYNLAGNDQEIISLLKGQSDKYYIGEKPESVSDTAKQILDISANGLGALNLVENDGEICYAYNAAIIDLKQKNITLNFVGIGYYSYNAIGESGETELNIVLASYQNGDMSNNVRSMAQVAYTAIEKGDENAEWLNECYIQKTAITVKFDTDGGSVIETQTVKYGETVVKPSDPQKEGVVFSRWELNGEPYDFSSPVKQNVTLKAVYKPEEIIPGKIGYFDEKFGESQFKVVNSKIEFTTEKAYGEENGSLKVTVLPGCVHTFGKLVKLTEVDVSAYDSLVLRVFNPNNYEAYFFLAEEGVSTTMDYLLKPNEWTEVRIPISRLLNAKDLMGLDFKVAQKNFASLEPNTTIYLSVMYAEKNQNMGPSEVVPGKLCYFDEQYGVAQFAADHVAIEFSSDTKHGDEAGSLKLTVQAGNNGNIGHLLNLTEADLSGYKVVKFYVYNPGTEDMWFATEGKWFSVLKEGKEENAQEVRCIAGKWTEVSINLSAITAAGKRLEEVALKANAFNWAALADDSTFYLSSVNAS